MKLFITLPLLFIAFNMPVNSGKAPAQSSNNGKERQEGKEMLFLEKFNKGEFSLDAPGFEENRGQFLASGGEQAQFVKFRYNRANTQIFLLGNGIAFQFTKPHVNTHAGGRFSELENGRSFSNGSRQIETFRMDMTLEGSNPNPEITAGNRSRDFRNYHSLDIMEVYSYNRIIYHQVYTGIDWVLYTTESGIKYDFIVHAGADPDQIRLRFSGHDNLYIDGEGNLVQENRLGKFVEKKPVSYQEGREIATRFISEGDMIRFSIGNYDRSKPLAIDPARIWATYYGDQSNEEGRACAVDLDGNIYLAGMTGSPTSIAYQGHQITYGGAEDAFLVKFNSSGARLWASYYGGAGGDGAFACVVDGNHNIYLAGETQSTTGIAYQGHQNSHGGGNYDAFLVKFNSGGVRQWATYYGGNGADHGYSCAVDAAGNVFLAGYTSSSFPATSIADGGFQNSYAGNDDAFLVKFDSSGVRQWGTYYGLSTPENGLGCATDINGNIYLTGTAAPNGDTGLSYNGHQNIPGGYSDAFLVKFDSDGVRKWATYYGGSLAETGNSCATDIYGNVFLTGHTTSGNKIAYGGHNIWMNGWKDAYLVKFDSSGTRSWGTYYGGPLDDEALYCATDNGGNIYITGYTNSASGIAYNGFQNIYGGSGVADAFIAKFNANGVRQWGSYYGGNSEDWGSSCAVSSNGVYLAGSTRSNNGIAWNGFQNVFAGLVWDAFLVKFDGADDCTGAAGGEIDIHDSLVCAGLSVNLNAINFSAGSGSSYQWQYSSDSFNTDINDLAGQTNPLLAPTGPLSSTTFFRLRVSCTSGAAVDYSNIFKIAVFQPVSITAQPQDTTVSLGGTAIFEVAATGTGVSYQWFKNGTVIPGATAPVYTISNISFADSGQYRVRLQGFCNTINSAIATLTVDTVIIWTGQTGPEWNMASNWSGNMPDASSSIFIPAGTPHSLVINDVFPVNNIHIGSGATVTVGSGGQLSIYGNFTNNGILNASSGTLAFLGTSGQDVSGFTAGTVIMNGSGITLNGDVTANNLTLTNGMITLGNHMLMLSASASGSASSHIVTNGTGSVRGMAVASGSFVFPVGASAGSYTPVTLANGGGLNYSVRVGQGVSPVITNSQRAINRTWHITPSASTGSDVTVTLHYADALANSSADPAAVMEVGVHDGSQWVIASPAGGISPSGTAQARTVTYQTTRFGPTVLANPGGLTYPASASIPGNEITGIQILPNIVSGDAVLRIYATRNMKADGIIVDAAGRTVMRFTASLQAGENTSRLNLAGVPAGVYRLVLRTPSGLTGNAGFIRL